MQHWTSQHFPRDIPVDLIFLGELCAQESATVSVAPTGFVMLPQHLIHHLVDQEIL